MATPRSTEARQGPAGVESGFPSTVNPAVADTRISHYVRDSTVPVNAALQSGLSRERDHTGILHTVSLLFSEPTSSAAATPTVARPEGSHTRDANTGSAVDVANATRGVGARFGGS